MDTIFMKSKNSKTSNTHGLLLNLTDKINLKRSDKYIKLWLTVQNSKLLVYISWLFRK